MADCPSRTVVHYKGPLERPAYVCHAQRAPSRRPAEQGRYAQGRPRPAPAPLPPREPARRCLQGPVSSFGESSKGKWEDISLRALHVRASHP